MSGTQERWGWADLSEVRQFGKYFLVTKLAEGGMAEIFLAKQVGPEGFERDVVVKRMLKHLSAVPDFVSMFLDEARLAARLFHPHIVQITDLGITDDQYYICMEYLPGEDLAHVITAAHTKSENVPLGVACRVMLAACEGLDFAHGYQEAGSPLNIVHRDVTPSNILVTYQGTVKLVDFGIAKAETKVAKTGVGTVKGKWVYMSPEQARGELLDRRSDVFSLGLTFYELLTGVRVFQRDNELAILKALLSGTIPNPKQHRKDLPEPLVQIMGKALMRDRAKRYQTAGDMGRDLERFLAGTTSGVGVSQLATYMKELFGTERVALKTQVPTLKALEQMGVAVPSSTESHPRRTDSADSAAPTIVRPDAGGQEAPTRAAVLPVGAIPDWKRHVPLAGGLALAFLGGLALLLAHPWGGTSPVLPGSPDRVAVAGPDAAGAGPAEQPDASGRAPADAGEAPKAECTRDSDCGARGKKAVCRAGYCAAPLTEKDIVGVVARNRARLLACIDRYRSALPGTEGQLVLTFTVKSNGAVTAVQVETKGIDATPLGACLVQQGKTLRFPRHTEAQVSFNLPFNYSVQ